MNQADAFAKLERACKLQKEAHRHSEESARLSEESAKLTAEVQAELAADAAPADPPPREFSDEERAAMRKKLRKLGRR